jgi:hypothetical protein
MIDTTVEEVRPLSQATKWVPSRRRGRPTHTSTLYRWKDEGLETIQVGGSCCTSREALQRFFEKLSRARGESTAPASRTIGKRLILPDCRY